MLSGVSDHEWDTNITDDPEFANLGGAQLEAVPGTIV
jgi:hypothetical protein